MDTFSNNHTTFTEFYQSTRSMLYSYCCSICDNEYDAQDLMQDTYLRAWLRMSQLRNVECSRRWLLSIAAHTYSNSRRKKKPQLWSDEMLEAIPDTTQIPEDESEGNMMCEILYSAIHSELTDIQRITITKYYLSGMQVKAIAQEMNCYKKTVYARLSRARKTLRIALHKKGIKTLAN